MEAAVKTLLRSWLLAGFACLAGCPGFGLGVEVERDGKSIGAECHKNPDGTWACNVKAHLDGDHSLPVEE